MARRQGADVPRTARISNVVRRIVSRPARRLENAGSARAPLKQARRDFSLDWYPDHLVSDREAADAVLGVPESEYRGLAARLWRPKEGAGGLPARWDGRAELLELVG